MDKLEKLLDVVIEIGKDVDIILAQLLAPQSNYSFLILNTLILLSNLLFAVLLNVYLFKKRRKDDREYNNSYDFYQKLIIENISNYIMPTKQFEKIINVEFNYIQQFSKEKKDHRPVIEWATNQIDRVYDAFTLDLMPIAKCYSDDFSNKLSEEFERLYDKVTIYATQASIGDNGSNRIKIIAKYSRRRDIFLTKMFSMIREYKPQI